MATQPHANVRSRSLDRDAHRGQHRCQRDARRLLGSTARRVGRKPWHRTRRSGSGAEAGAAFRSARRGGTGLARVPAAAAGSIGCGYALARRSARRGATALPPAGEAGFRHAFPPHQTAGGRARGRDGLDPNPEPAPRRGHRRQRSGVCGAGRYCAPLGRRLDGGAEPPPRPESARSRRLCVLGETRRQERRKHLPQGKSARR